MSTKRRIPKNDANAQAERGIAATSPSKSTSESSSTEDVLSTGETATEREQADVKGPDGVGERVSLQGQPDESVPNAYEDLITSQPEQSEVAATDTERSEHAENGSMQAQQPGLAEDDEVASSAKDKAPSEKIPTVVTNAQNETASTTGPTNESKEQEPTTAADLTESTKHTESPIEAEAPGQSMPLGEASADADRYEPEQKAEEANSSAQTSTDEEQIEENRASTQKMAAVKRPKKVAEEAPKPAKAAEKKAMPALPITPVPRPRFDHIVTPQQEEAANRLERKRKQPRHGTDITPVVKGRTGQEQPQSAATQGSEGNRQHSQSNAGQEQGWSQSAAMQGSGGNRQHSQSNAALVDMPTSALPKTPPVSLMSSSLDGEYKDLELLRWQRQRKLLLRHISRKHMRMTRVGKQRIVTRVWLTILSIFLAIMAIFLSLTGAGSYVAYRFYSDTQNEFTLQILNLRDLMPKDNLKIYDSKGILLDQLVDNGVHTTVPLNQISQQMVNAEVSTEDKNFWTNPGIDIARIFQSALDDLRTGHVVAGGSTITQQLIKNLVVGNETTLQRKLQEIMLTPMINDRYSKSDIMEMYLNTVYYGEQAYGVDAAANIYYGIPDQTGKFAAQRLDLAQSAMLAGIVSSPSANDPLLHPQAAYTRFDFVINSMVTNGYITEAQAVNAAKEVHSAHFFKSPVNMVDRAPHFDQFVLGQLEQAFHLTRQQLSRSDMSVNTTLDIVLQNKIQKIAQEHIAELAYNNVTNAAEVLIDYHTGAIRSLLGSIDYNNKSIDGEFDVATSYRQPGSSFKPYVYVTAFEQGASPAQAINDSALTIKLPGGDPPTFTPMNYDLRFHGAMTLRCALQNSLNVPAVKVLQHVGIANAMKTAYDMGITTYEGTPGYSLVLGGLGVRLIDHTSAFGTFANGGVHVPYYAIQQVTFATTHQAYMHPIDAGTHVISPQLAYMMTNVLSDNTDRLPEFFDCNPLQLYSNSQTACYEGDRGTIRPAAAKTGTTNDFRDNWTLGYTSDYVMGVWAGNDNNSPMYNVSGVQGAAPIWHDSMLVAEQNHPSQDFTNPGGLQHETVTYPDGLTTTDWFLPGTVPTFNSFQPTPTAGDNGNSNGGNGMISMNSSLGTPLGKHPPKHGGNGNGGNNGNGNSFGSTTYGAPYCPNDFSFTGSTSSANGQGVW